MKLSVILPARNEAAAIGPLLAEISLRLPEAELIVVDDGSTDDTAAIAARHGASVISHPYPKGNGATVKTGAACRTTPAPTEASPTPSSIASPAGW